MQGIAALATSGRPDSSLLLECSHFLHQLIQQTTRTHAQLPAQATDEMDLRIAEHLGLQGQRQQLATFQFIDHDESRQQSDAALHGEAFEHGEGVAGQGRNQRNPGLLLGLSQDLANTIRHAK